MPRPHVDAAEIARLLGVDRETVYNLVRAGRIPALRLGTGAHRSTLRFDPDAVFAALENAEVAR
jgi:excisionase family DNA binding protein